METTSVNAIKQFAILILVFGVINGVLWVGQELYYGADTKKINEIETFLKNEKLTVNTIETALSVEETQLDQKDNLLNSYKSFGNTEEYNNGVYEYNNLLQKYQLDLDNYKTKITAYNLKVDEVNALIKKSGTRWYLIPIPLPGNHYNSKI